MGTLTWQDERTEGGREANKTTLRKISDMIAAGDREGVLAATGDWHPADALACLLRLRPAKARLAFDWLPDVLGLKVLAELDNDLYTVLYSPESERTFANIIEMMDVDEAVDTLQELPRDFASNVIATRPDADRIAEVLRARDDSAASVMRLGVLMAPEHWTVGQLTEDIRLRTEEIGKIDMMFVVDEARRPVGFLRFREVLQARADVALTSIVHPELVVVDGETDREDVLKLARSKGLNALGVVDASGKLVGGISARELQEIVQEEAEEDMLRMGSVSPATTQFDGPFTILKRRLPWLLGGLCGASFAAAVIGSYEEALAQAAVLASFIPVVMATAGNAGIQASTVSVQTLTTGANWRGDFGTRMLREFFGALFNGLSIGAITALVVLVVSLVLPIAAPQMLALSAFLALTLVTTIAGTMGAMIPFLLRSLGLDPAVATGIFITTTNDVFGVLIFFVVASALYL
ncbi:magnesium transporter [Shimia isoporae]|uniref:Magnesium transporter MgtE n=1 Tax=Shimia isoporae TaxID=647720 RepID=A0A4R1NT19_9RHOB|nr:magnesium transporter [Shimia isoporae]TCL08418.1 magnesium transporter [Shimia isoporae]